MIWRVQKRERKRINPNKSLSKMRDCLKILTAIDNLTDNQILLLRDYLQSGSF